MAVQPKLPQKSQPGSEESHLSDMALAMKPHTPSLGADDPNAIIALPNSPFFLRHHRSNWEVSVTLDEPTILPEIAVFVLRPGVNGVRTTGPDEADNMAYRMAVRNEVDNHDWNFIDPAQPIPKECLPPGMPPGGYLRSPDCIHPLTGGTGTRFMEAWSVPGPGDDGVTEFAFHRESYELWKLWLMQSGQIEGPTEKVRKKLAARAGRHLENRQTAGYTNKAVETAAIKAKQDLVDSVRNAVLPTALAAK